MAIDTEIAKVVTRPQKASAVFKIPRSTIFQLSTDYPVTDFLKVQNVHVYRQDYINFQRQSLKV